MLKRIILACALLASSEAQANDWEKFYQPFSASIVPLEQSPEPPSVDALSNPETDIARMYREGYRALGMTQFNSGSASTRDAIKLAIKLKASKVLITTSLSSSTTTSIPLTLPTKTTSTTNGTVSAYGSGGYANGRYSGTTTTNGTQTTYIPMTVNRFDKAAVFFAKLQHVGIGILVREMTDGERATFETNQAMIVVATRDGSPGYSADLLPGDVLTMADGQPISPARWSDLLRRTTTVPVERVELEFIRRGERRKVTLQIPPDWQPSNAAK
jgi:PDZ domain